MAEDYERDRSGDGDEPWRFCADQTLSAPSVHVVLQLVGPGAVAGSAARPWRRRRLAGLSVWRSPRRTWPGFRRGICGCRERSFVTVWAAAERDAPRDWYALGVVMTCRRLANAVVHLEVGPAYVAHAPERTGTVPVPARRPADRLILKQPLGQPSSLRSRPRGRPARRPARAPRLVLGVPARELLGAVLRGLAFLGGFAGADLGERALRAGVEPTGRRELRAPGGARLDRRPVGAYGAGSSNSSVSTSSQRPWRCHTAPDSGGMSTGTIRPDSRVR